jgi:hypothetical protein
MYSAPGRDHRLSGETQEARQDPEDAKASNSDQWGYPAATYGPASSGPSCPAQPVCPGTADPAQAGL